MIHINYNPVSGDETPEPVRVVTPAGAGSGLPALHFIDILGQIALSILAWAPAGAGLLEGADGLMMYRLPVLAWQLISLLATAVAYEGEPGFGVHTAAFWPAVLSLVCAILLIPFGFGNYILWGLYLAAQLLSLPYLVLSVASIGRSRPANSRPERMPVSVHTLAGTKQTDLLGQLACIVLPVLVTLHNHRPLAEALITAYPLIAAWQALSVLTHLYLARDFRPWRSLIRVPYTALQLTFMAALIIHFYTTEAFSCEEMLRHPAGQLLAAAYLVLTYIEWERISKEPAARNTRRRFS